MATHPDDADTPDAPTIWRINPDATLTRSVLAALALSSRAFEMRCRTKRCRHPAVSVVADPRRHPRPLCLACADDAIRRRGGREYPLDAFSATADGADTAFTPVAENTVGTTFTLATDDADDDAWISGVQYHHDDTDAVDGVVDLAEVA